MQCSECKIGLIQVSYCPQCDKPSKEIDIKAELEVVLSKNRQDAINSWNIIKPVTFKEELNLVLNEIALNAPNNRIRRQAMRYVDDNILSMIAMRDRSYDNRVLAISLISDEKYLIHLGANGKSIDEKLLATRMIETRKSLAALSEKVNDKRLQKFIDKKFSSAV
ncbi:MAG: hypothetical protein INQ03_00635 [Candidatus Heimdallarchaeota archaeon]|nr:hypothetical protein [Candidatus Heimdallarchaeota archaeon]